MSVPDSITKILSVAMIIPVGRVATYGQIADLAGLPGRARLVSKALKKADHDMSIPWHRILRSDGKIAFAANSEQAQEQKQRLLSEGVAISGYRITLKQYQWQPELHDLLHRLKY
ncbi:MGMT family protein [Alteromonas sp. 14N.309.X.WAT.G.H12]|uniref:MGMT family protein n=1 Tax=Alteromonas sp. 14N.309.X.WAT.G.H12 TaxID=3120824 RepID=UPI002FD77D3E